MSCCSTPKHQEVRTEGGGIAALQCACCHKVIEATCPDCLKSIKSRVMHKHRREVHHIYRTLERAQMARDRGIANARWSK